MADNGLADFVRTVTVANSALGGKFNKSLGATYAKTTLLQKAFGPFLDSWLRFKGGILMLLKPLNELLGPFTLLKKTSDGIKLTFLGMITLLIAVAVGLSALSDRLGLNNDSTNMLDMALGGLKDTLTTVWETISSIDFQPILDNGQEVMTGLASVLSVLLAEAIIIIDFLINKFLEFPAVMSDLGFIDAFSNAFDNLSIGVAFVMASINEALVEVGLQGSSVSDLFIMAFEMVASTLMNLGVVDLLLQIIDTLGVVGLTVGLVIGNIITFFARLTQESGFQAFADDVFDIFDAIIGKITDWFAFIEDIFSTVNDALMGKITWDQAFSDIMDRIIGTITDFIDWLTNLDMGDIVDGVFGSVEGLIGGIGNALGYSEGGIATGPSSGYPAVLHGTEAVVPLPDGRSIPVSLEGSGGTGGGNATFNINVTGAKGDPESIAKAVGKEVQRVFKSRSRSGGYGRGI